MVEIRLKHSDPELARSSQLRSGGEHSDPVEEHYDLCLPFEFGGEDFDLALAVDVWRGTL